MGRHWRLWSRGEAWYDLYFYRNTLLKIDQGTKDRSGKTNWEAIAAIQGRAIVSWIWGVGWGWGWTWVYRASGEKVLDSGYILKVEPQGIADRSDTGWGSKSEVSDASGVLDLSNWENGIAVYWDGKCNERSRFWKGIKSSVLNKLSLRCLLDINV